PCVCMEFRTHAQAENEKGLRVRWPVALRQADVHRVRVNDELGENPTEHYIDFDLAHRDGYELTITFRPTAWPAPIQTIADLLRNEVPRRARFFGLVRYVEVPELLL